MTDKAVAPIVEKTPRGDLACLQMTTMILMSIGFVRWVLLTRGNRHE